MAYQVLTADNRTLIVDIESGIQVKVKEKNKGKNKEITSYCLATLYRIKGGFIPEKVYEFEAVTGTDLLSLKQAVDFFFTTLLETELYVKEVPPDSAFFAEEAERLYGKTEEIKDGTTGVIPAGRTE